METSKLSKLWVEEESISRDFFSKGGRVPSFMQMNHVPIQQNLKHATDLKIQMMLVHNEDGGKEFRPCIQIRVPEDGGKLIEAFEVTALKKNGSQYPGVQEIEKEITKYLDKSYSEKSNPGEPIQYVKYSCLNWITCATDESVFNRLFEVRNNQNYPVRAHAYVMSKHTLSKIKYYLRTDTITDVCVCFGVHYGRPHGEELSFTPIYLFSSKLDFSNRKTDEDKSKYIKRVLHHLNECSLFEGARFMAKGDMDEEDPTITYFNYLRPCPPFGNCDED